MIAAEHREVAAVIGKLACLDVLHPGAIHTQGHVMLRLARHRARMATDALAMSMRKPNLIAVPVLTKQNPLPNYTIAPALISIEAPRAISRPRLDSFAGLHFMSFRAQRGI